MSRLPNLFVLGAGRCGTTSLHQQLAQHPDVFMSSNKEPTFFCDFFGLRNPWNYLELFRGATHEHVIGESSHAYLSCSTSAQMLKAYVPDAQFIVMLRNPVDRAYSLYCWMTAAGNEWLAPFEKALQAEDRRATNSRFFRNNPQYFHNYLYFQSGLYGLQLRRYLELFARSQFLFVRFDDLKNDSRGVLQSIYRFIDVDPAFVPSDSLAVNPSRSVRSARLQFFLRRRVEAALVKLRLGRVRPLVDRIANWNITENRPASLSNETRLQLVDRYRNDLQTLECLTGFDTSAWRQAPMIQTNQRR